MASHAGGPVLIVADNDKTRYVLERILALKGPWSCSVDGGQAALA